jgi:hypothetical protein
MTLTFSYPFENKVSISRQPYGIGFLKIRSKTNYMSCLALYISTVVLFYFKLIKNKKESSMVLVCK